MGDRFRPALLVVTLFAGAGLLTLGVWLSADARSWSLALNTAKLSATTCAISVPIGAVLALLFSRTDLPCRKAFAVLVGVLLFVPLYVQVAAWQAGFGLLGWYTVANSGITWLEGWRGAIWVHSLAAVPWVMLIVGLGLRYVEPELEEEALLNGTAWQVFRRVTLRRALGGIGAATLWVAVSAAGEMTVTDLFQIRTYAEELYTEVAIGGEPGDAPLRVLPGIAVTVCLVIAGLFASAYLVPPSGVASVRQRHVFGLGGWRWPLLIFVLLQLALLWVVPVGNLCHQAGVNVTQASGGRVRSWSPFKFGQVLANTPGRFSGEFLDSTIVGVGAASAAVIVAVPLAWLARRGGLRSMPAFVSTACLLAIPGPVIGVALIWLLNRPELPWLLVLYDHPFFAPLAALALRGLPLSILVLWHALRTIPEETLEMAATEGAGPTRRLLRIGLPQRPAAVLVAWLVALAVAWGDLAASVLVLPPGTHTLAWRISSLVHFGVDDQLAGISLWLMTLFAILGAAVLWLIRKVES